MEMDHIVPTEADCAYFAGFFDGEGCIGLRRIPYSKNRERVSYILRLDIVNTNLEVLEWIQARFGGRLTEGKPARSHWSPYYKLTMCTNGAYKTLKLITPYLRVKRDMAVLGIEFFEACYSVVYGGFKPVPESVLIQREEFFHRMKALR